MAARKMTRLYPEELPARMPVLDQHHNPTVLYRVLYWIANHSLATRADIALAMGLDMSTPSAKKVSVERVRRACATLEEHKFIEQSVIKFWRLKLHMIRLTAGGDKYCQNSYPWEIKNSDWDKLYNRHNGRINREHAAAVLNFAYHARLRGWEAIVLPYEFETNSEPDVMIKKGYEITYVEVEMRGWRASKKFRKWDMQTELQGRPSACLLTTEAANNIAIRFQELGYSNYDVTSLEYLQATAYNAKRSNGLWQFTTEER